MLESDPTGEGDIVLLASQREAALHPAIGKAHREAVDPEGTGREGEMQRCIAARQRLANVDPRPL